MDSAKLTPYSSGFGLPRGVVRSDTFAGLGLIFMNTSIAEKMDPSRLIAILIGAVFIAGLGLALWFAFT